jgi:hypothetical protein
VILCTSCADIGHVLDVVNHVAGTWDNVLIDIYLFPFHKLYTHRSMYVDVLKPYLALQFTEREKM